MQDIAPKEHANIVLENKGYPSTKTSKSGSIDLHNNVNKSSNYRNIIQLHIICTTNQLVKECSSLSSSQPQAFLSLFAAFMNPTITCISSNCLTVQKQSGEYKSQFPEKRKNKVHSGLKLLQKFCQV